MNQYFDNNENLKSKLKLIKYNYDNNTINFYSDLGVFSKDHIDYASRFLLETYLKNKKEIHSILDVGCGYGFLGITLSKILNSEVELIDVNNRCIHLTEKNLKENNINGKVYLSNGYENVENKFDLIITNPPIRAGKKVYYDILKNAVNYLNKNGELWFVISKDQGAKSTFDDLKEIYKVHIEDKSKGFYVISAKTD